jgi:hypothetical protein
MKWPQLKDMSTEGLFRLYESWNQIEPHTDAEIDSHTESMNELEAELSTRTRPKEGVK